MDAMDTENNEEKAYVCQSSFVIGAMDTMGEENHEKKAFICKSSFVIISMDTENHEKKKLMFVSVVHV